MKRILLALVAVVVGILLVRWAYSALASDETKIRRMVAEMEAGFNEGSGRRATAGLAETWRHGEEELRRDDLRGYLLAEFQAQRTQKARQLTLRVSVPEDLLSITVDGGTASMELEARFEKLRAEQWGALWTARIRAELTHGDAGWKITRTHLENVEGRGLRG